MSVIRPSEVKQHLAERREVAFLDVREHGEYGEAHPFHGVTLPYSRFEVDVERLVPRKTVRLVLFDQSDDGRARACAGHAEALGYGDVRVLEGGAEGWAAAGYTLFAGVNVPSKTFGELVHEELHPPAITADELAAWQAQGRDVLVVDGRPVEEYRKMSIPQAWCCPNGELGLRIDRMAPDPQTPIVINCAGRTRSLVGVQLLRWLGLPNPVYALENGTQGWRLAGLELEHSQSRRYPDPVQPAGTRAQTVADVAARHGAAALDRAGIEAWLADPERTTFVFDVRTREEYERGHPAGVEHAPGGQLLQATDQWVGVRFARIVVLDDDGCRAPLVAACLSLLGFDAAYARMDEELLQAELTGLPRESQAATRWPAIAQLELARVLAAPTGTVLDLRPGMQFRAGHLPGAVWINRSQLAQRLAFLPDSELVLVADRFEQAAPVAADLLAAGHRIAGWWPFAAAAVEAAGGELVSTPDVPADADCIDYLFFVHDRHDGNLESARRYLEWEIGLVPKLDAEERALYRF